MTIQDGPLNGNCSIHNGVSTSASGPRITYKMICSGPRSIGVIIEYPRVQLPRKTRYNKTSPSLAHGSTVSSGRGQLAQLQCLKLTGIPIAGEDFDGGTPCASFLRSVRNASLAGLLNECCLV